MATVLGLACCAVATVAAGARDPTRPINYQTAGSQAAAFVLQAIITGDQRREVIINGQRLREGESLNGVRIINIDAGQVKLESSEGIKILTLRPSIHTK